MFPPKLRIGGITFVAVLFEGGLLVLALALGWFLDSPPFQQYCFSWRLALWAVPLTVPLLLLLFWCTHSGWRPFVRIVREVENGILPLLQECSLSDFVVIAAVAGTAEEALFRGVIQPGLANLVNLWGAVALTGLLFGLVHFITPTYALVAGLLGVYLGWVMIATGNLLLPILVHALYDLAALVYLVRKFRKGRPEIMSHVSPQ